MTPFVLEGLFDLKPFGLIIYYLSSFKRTHFPRSRLKLRIVSAFCSKNGMAEKADGRLSICINVLLTYLLVLVHCGNVFLTKTICCYGNHFCSSGYTGFVCI